MLPPPQAVCNERKARVMVRAPKAAQPLLILDGAQRFAFATIAAPMTSNKAINGMLKLGRSKGTGQVSHFIGSFFEGGTEERAVVVMVSVD